MPPLPPQATAAGSTMPLQAPPPATPAARLRTLAVALVLVAGGFFIAGLYARILTDRNAIHHDFIEYWAQGQLLAQHANAFDPAAILKVEQSAGFRRNDPQISFSPPVALWFSVPLGYVSAPVGLLLWHVAQLAALSISLWLIWILIGRPDPRWQMFGFVFPPVIACLFVGQLSIFFLLCLAIFLLQHQRRPFLAGAVLMPFALKPHIILPFALVLLLWVVLRRCYSLLAGAAVALLASCAASLYLAPQAWTQYRHMMAVSGVMDAFIPAIAVALRFAVAPHAIWTQFVPEVCACVWALWFYSTRRQRWQWRHHGMIVLMVAAICTPYGWFFDESILLPAVLAGVYSALPHRRSLVPLILFTAAALAEIVASLTLDTHYYLWTTPAWLAWYLYATHSPRTARGNSPA